MMMYLFTKRKILYLTTKCQASNENQTWNEGAALSFLSPPFDKYDGQPIIRRSGREPSDLGHLQDQIRPQAAFYLRRQPRVDGDVRKQFGVRLRLRISGGERLDRGNSRRTRFRGTTSADTRLSYVFFVFHFNG